MSVHPARSVMEPHRRGPRIVRAGVGPDDTLPQIGEVHPLVVQVPLDQLDHGPLEQDRARFGIATEPALDLVARRAPGRATDRRLRQGGERPGAAAWLPASRASRRGPSGRSGRSRPRSARRHSRAGCCCRPRTGRTGRRPPGSSGTRARADPAPGSPAGAAGRRRRRRVTSGRRATAPPWCRRRPPDPAPRAPGPCAPPARGRPRRRARCVPPRRR